MATAKRDANMVPVILGLSNADGTTPLSPYVDSATNRLLVSDANAGGAAGTTVIIASGTLSVLESGTVRILGNVTTSAASGGTTVIVESGTVSVLESGTVRVLGAVAVTQSGTWDEVGINDSGNAITVDWAGTAPPIGAGLEATALRVTVATDSTGVLSVDDNSSSLTVDNAGLTELAAAINASSQMDINIAASAATLTVASHAVTNAGTFAVQVDVAALTALQLIDNVVTTEDTASANGDSGIVIFARRTATPADTSGLDLDYEALQMDNGRLWTSTTIDAALPAGTNAIGKLAANSGVDIGDVDILSIAAGDNNIGNVDVVTLPALAAGTNNIGDVDVLSLIPGTGATNAGKAVDDAAGATDTGSATLAVRDDALAALTPLEGDYVNLRVDANGALWTHDDALDAALGGSELQVDVVGALPAGTNAIGKLAANSGVDIGDVDVLSIAAGDNNIGVRRKLT